MEDNNLQIITIENTENKQQSVLKTGTVKVDFPLSRKNMDLIQAMQNKLYKLGGVGLAAPQVGANTKIIAIYIPETAMLLRDNAIQHPMHTLINPEYEVINSSKIMKDFEACYSVSSKAGMVPRYQAIKVKYQDEIGRMHEIEATDFYARVLQHEIDHLNGVLIMDRLTPDCIQGTIEEMIEYRRRNLTPEKQVLLDKLMAEKGLNNKD